MRNTFKLSTLCAALAFAAGTASATIPTEADFPAAPATSGLAATPTEQAIDSGILGGLTPLDRVSAAALAMRSATLSGDCSKFGSTAATLADMPDYVPAVAARGAMLLRGICVPMDTPLGLSLLRDADAEGVSAAGALIGDHFHRVGESALAEYWLTRAAAQGSAAAHMRLGLQAFEGQGAPHDGVKALGHFRAAAQMGDQAGLYLVGAHYARGIIVEQDLVQAAAHFAAAGKDPQAIAAYQYVAGQLTKAQITAAAKLAKTLPVAAN